MRPIRWSTHALRNLTDREIELADAEMTLMAPDYVIPDLPGRRILMRRYFDHVLQQPMLLRIVVEDATDEIVVITLYKTSQINRYLKGVKS